MERRYDKGSFKLHFSKIGLYPSTGKAFAIIAQISVKV